MKEVVKINDRTEVEVLTVPDIARYLRISRSAAYELVRRNDFPAIRINSTIRIMRSSFENWLSKQENGQARAK